MVSVLNIKKKEFYLMKKLSGKEIKHKIAVFISGRGSNLKSIIKSSKKKNSLYKVAIVVSDNKNAKGLLIAKKKGIINYSIDFTKSKKLGNKVLKLVICFSLSLLL